MSDKRLLITHWGIMLLVASAGILMTVNGQKEDQWFLFGGIGLATCYYLASMFASKNLEENSAKLAFSMGIGLFPLWGYLALKILY